jgi:hypothetical protein
LRIHASGGGGTIGDDERDILPRGVSLNTCVNGREAVALGNANGHPGMFLRQTINTIEKNSRNSAEVQRIFTEAWGRIVFYGFLRALAHSHEKFTTFSKIKPWFPENRKVD